MLKTSAKSLARLAKLHTPSPNVVQLPACTPARALHVSLSSRTSTESSSRPKRPSPYRLIPPQTFLASFAPLHIAGWRLVSLPGSPAHHVDNPLEQGADLQDRRLVKNYEFEGDKQGWRDLLALVQRIGEEVEIEDHHPTVVISPAGDYVPTSSALNVDESTGYVLEISIHTHTPLPPIGSPPPVDGANMRPGVTGKDLRLAEKVEKAFEQLGADAEA